MSLLLSIMMIAESIGTSAVAYAEEDAQTAAWEEPEQTTETDLDENVSDNSDNIEGTEEAADGDTSVDNPEREEETPDDLDMSKEEEKQEADTGQDEEELTDDEELSDGEKLSDEEKLSEEIESSDGDIESEETPAEEEEEQFSGMPDNYRLTSEQQAEKRLLASKIGDVDEESEGVQYVSRQIMTWADTQSEAEMIAEAYNAAIENFENGLLTMTLEEGTTVHDALQAAASSETSLPAVWPNYYRYVYGENVIEVEETEYDADEEIEYEESDIPTQESYQAALAAYDDKYLDPSSSNYQWQHVAVGSPYAWSEGYRGDGIKVAVLDTGIVDSHEDLKIAGSYNASSASGSASDVHGHGTHVAGIIGAQLNNNKGGAGIAPDAELYCIKVIGDNGSGTDADVIQGLMKAIELDVDVVNMSLGGPGYNGAFQEVVNDAYEKGIAFFAAAGNDGISVNNYPASYDHVICVAATDENNARAAFSTYGSWVDISAPGLNIWSTSNRNDTSYEVMSGTSMACPVAAGEAAVILGAYDSLQGVEKDGKKVDTLEALMKKNSVKASGTGMGSGVPSLTKLFKLNTAATKPAAPTIKIVPNNESAAQLVTVTITAQSGTTIYYTRNGKTPAFQNGEPDIKSETMRYTAPVIIQDSNKATIKAIAVNESGVSSAVKSASYTLKPYVTEITISGVKKVAKGKSIQLSAAVTPSYATNKKVTWELYKDGKKVDAKEDAKYAKEVGVSINNSGKVTATKNAQTGSYTVRAVAKDEGGKIGEYKISVIDSVMVGSVKFGKKSLSVNLPTNSQVSLVMDGGFEATLNDEAKTPANAITDIIWKSSNTSVATVDAQGIMRPLKAGKVTITALANDSNGKKATCTVTITQLATDVSVTGPVTVAAGRNVTFKATVMPADTKNKKVTWELYKDGKKVDAKTDADYAKEVGVSISAGGKVTAAKNARPGTYTIKAISQGRPSIECEKSFNVTDGVINNIAFENSKESKITLYRRNPATGKGTVATTVKVTIRGKEDGTAPDLDAYSVSNSAPGIAAVAHSRSGNTIRLTINPTGNATGKTKITVASTDGSKKKLTCTVTVVNPVSKIHIVSKTITRAYSAGGISGMRVVQGKSLGLKAVLESEYGKVSNTGVTWSISAEADSGVKINSSGKVTTTKQASTGKTYTVTATAKDGSNVSDSYLVNVVAPATRISVDKLQSGSFFVNEISQLPQENGEQRFFQFRISDDVSGGYVTAASSNKKIMEAAVSNGYLLLSPNKAGMVTVTLKATDGSGVKATYKFRVTDEIYEP